LNKLPFRISISKATIFFIVVFYGMTIWTKHFYIFDRIIIPVMITVVNHEDGNSVETTSVTFDKKASSLDPFFNSFWRIGLIFTLQKSSAFSRTTLSRAALNFARWSEKNSLADKTSKFYRPNTVHCLVIARSRAIFCNLDSMCSDIERRAADLTNYVSCRIILFPIPFASTRTETKCLPSVTGNVNQLFALYARQHPERDIFDAS
jgi:hypothetical protein